MGDGRLNGFYGLVRSGLIGLTVTDVVVFAPGAFVLGLVVGLVVASYYKRNGPGR